MPPPSDLPPQEDLLAGPGPVEEHMGPPEPVEQADPVDHTQLLHNEEESFALAPIDASVVRGEFS